MTERPITVEDRSYETDTWEIEWKAVKRWTFDEYVGHERAHELGFWESDDHPDRTWSVPATITAWESLDSIERKVTIEVDEQEVMEFHATRDMWGTWYNFNVKGMIAMEDGRRSFWSALIEALEYMKEWEGGGTYEPMKPPTVEEWND